MTTAAETLARCRTARVEIDVGPGDRLKLRYPSGALSGDLKAAIAAHKAAIIDALTAVCPTCTRPYHDRDRISRTCWKCCNRPCECCGRLTGSAFIRTCDRCAYGAT